MVSNQNLNLLSALTSSFDSINNIWRSKIYYSSYYKILCMFVLHSFFYVQIISSLPRLET
jgi:hypothetical protein